MTRYRLPARLLHWIMAVLVLAMIPAGLVMVQQGIARPLQDALFLFHKNTGVLLLGLVALRLVWRWRNPPPPLPATLPPAQARIAGLTHWAIYAALIALPVLGYIRVRAGGFPIETLDALGLPPLVPRSEPLAELAKSLHALAGFALAGLVLMHMGAAAYHGLIRRDGIFSRMWPPFGAGRDN